MPSGVYKRSKLHIKHITGKDNSFYGKKHTKESKLLNALAHDRPIGSIRILKDKGYRQIKISPNKWMRLSRYLVEQYIGYKLKKGWMIHHIDDKPSNDNLSNLYIFRNMGLHLNFTLLVKYGIISRFILKSNLKEFKLMGRPISNLKLKVSVVSQN
jgi:hypothetical protein